MENAGNVPYLTLYFKGFSIYYLFTFSTLNRRNKTEINVDEKSNKKLNAIKYIVFYPIF